MPRNPENDRYALERDLDLELRPTVRSPGEATNPRRRKKTRRPATHADPPYRKTRADRRAEQAHRARARLARKLSKIEDTREWKP